MSTLTETSQASPVLRLNLSGGTGSEPSRITCTPVHPTFGAEIAGVDFSRPPSDHVLNEIKDAVGKYGFVVLRDTGMTDQDYVDFGSRFGELAPAESRRFPTKNLADPSNLYLDGNIVKPGELRWFMAKETALFHVDTSYDARRARLTSIIARQLPPPGTGGATEFGDTRTAYDDLDEETKALLEDKVGVHSHFHSRRVALPNFPTFKALDPWDYPMHRHKIVVTHAGSGRKDLYIASHLHHIEGMDPKESDELILRLRKMVEQPKYVAKVYYQQPGDVVIWDNTAVVHRAGGNEGEGWSGKHVRDIRKWMVYDNTPEEWGMNERGTPKHLAGPVIQAMFDELHGIEGKVYDFDED
ncbi:alpha-ketoglutarate-dependent 2 [Kockovaella imperatae]|uniref:Alpha-ketoglutarate-dependent 2 n=1 Tax=Kockovaella imperatae TaxID=4999 RepID=A0A1Y1UFT5_9TREE|nr:alpha-ketoglutarate-dependent 2 [Kockovaella imperatae]ORX35935.1 alpha-ketoglutarate-dependent 2 [Kockovaella imperatae]